MASLDQHAPSRATHPPVLQVSMLLTASRNAVEFHRICIEAAVVNALVLLLCNQSCTFIMFANACFVLLGCSDDDLTELRGTSLEQAVR